MEYWNNLLGLNRRQLNLLACLRMFCHLSSVVNWLVWNSYIFCVRLQWPNIVVRAWVSLTPVTPRKVWDCNTVLLVLDSIPKRHALQYILKVPVRSNPFQDQFCKRAHKVSSFTEPFFNHELWPPPTHTHTLWRKPISTACIRDP